MDLEGFVNLDKGCDKMVYRFLDERVFIIFKTRPSPRYMETLETLNFQREDRRIDHERVKIYRSNIPRLCLINQFDKFPIFTRYFTMLLGSAIPRSNFQILRLERNDASLEDKPNYSLINEIRRSQYFLVIGGTRYYREILEKFRDKRHE